MTNRLTLDEAIAHADDIAKNYPAKIDCPEDLAHVGHNHQLARWLTELKERRKLGFLPPCRSCISTARCTVTCSGREADSWHCTMYEWTEK